MPADFVLKASSEFGVNVLHSQTRHLYLFGIGEGGDGRRAFTSASCRPFKKIASEAQKYQVDARAFAEGVAKELGLIEDTTIIVPSVEIEGSSEINTSESIAA